MLSNVKLSNITILLFLILLFVLTAISLKPNIHGKESHFACKISSFYWGTEYAGRVCICSGEIERAGIALDTPSEYYCKNLGFSFEHPENLIIALKNQLFNLRCRIAGIEVNVCRNARMYLDF